MTTQTETDPPAPPPPARAAKARKYIEPGQWDQHKIWEIIESVPDDHWGQLVQGYLYRHEPTYTPTQKGDGSYILKFVEPLTQEHVKEQFGSGAYALRLVDRDGDKKKYEKFEIIDAQYPPKLPNPEWKEHGVNRRWIFSKDEPAPKADAGDDFERAEKLLALMSKAAAANGNKGPSDAQLMMDRFEKLTERIIELTRQQPDRTGEAFALLEQAKNLLPTVPPPAEDKMTPLLLELLLKRENGPAAAPRNPIEDMRATLELMRELKEEANPQPKSDPNDKWVMIAQILGPPVTALASSIAMQKQQAPPAQPQPGAQPPQIAAGEQQPAQPQQQAPQQAPTQDPHVLLIRQILPLIAQPLLQSLSDDETTGGDFADWVLAGYGAQILSQAQQAPAATWVAEIMGAPELWQALQQAGVDQAKLEKFVDEFREYDPAAGDS